MLGEKLEELRRRKGVRQEDVADYLNIARPTYTQYENNKRRPDIDTLKKIADFFDCSTDYLLGKAVERNTKKQKLYDVIARAKDLPEENIEQVSDALEALLKHHEEKLKKKKDTK